MNIRKIAKIGEKLAINYLIRKNYQILKTNVRFQHGEIDILAKKNKKIIFIEVKTRTNWHFGYPEQAVDSYKKQKLLAAINQYIFKTNYQGQWQVDLVAIDLMGKTAKLRHYQGIELE